MLANSKYNFIKEIGISLFQTKNSIDNSNICISSSLGRMHLGSVISVIHSYSCWQLHASFIEPFQDIPSHRIYILIRLSEQEGVHHAVIDLDSLILAHGLVIQLSAHIGISHHISTSMKHDERDGDIRKPGAEAIGGPEQFDHRPQPGLAVVPHGVAGSDDPLVLDLDRLVDEIGGGDDGKGGQEPADEGEDGRDGPPGPDAIGDLAHGGHQDCAMELGGEEGVAIAEEEVDQEADGTAHGFTIQEAPQVRIQVLLVLFDDIIEVGNAVLDDCVEIGYEGLEALRTAVAGQIQGEAGVAVLGEEDRG